MTSGLDENNVLVSTCPNPANEVKTNRSGHVFGAQQGSPNMR